MMLLRITHIEDSPEARQRNVLQFWGIEDKASFESSDIDKHLKYLETTLNGLSPPASAVPSCEIVFVFDDKTKQWRRALVVDVSNDRCMIKTFFIDTGETTWAPLIYLRYLPDDMETSQVLKTRRAMANKYILADVAPPRSRSMAPKWSDIALMFLKTEVEGKVWKAETVASISTVRLFDWETNEALAKTMVDNGFAFPSQSYQETALARGISPLPSNTISAISPLSPAVAFLPTVSTLPAVFRKPNLPYTSPEELVEASLAHQELSFLRNEFPTNEHLVVKVVSAPQGPYGFFVHLHRDEEDLVRLQTQLQLHRFAAYEFIPKIGAPCILSSCDGRNYRGSVNSMRDSCRYLVELVDYGRSELCDFTQLHRITHEFVNIPILGYRVSLEDAERLIQIKGLDQLFQGIITNARILTAKAVQGVPNRVVLFNHENRSVRDVLADIVGFSKMSNPYRTPSPLPTHQAFPSTLISIPDDVTEEEPVTVTRVYDAGHFFGILKKRSIDRLEKLNMEMFTLYNREPNPPLLYADARSHVGHCGVVKLSKEQKYYRARVQREMVNDVQVLLVDDGRRMVVPRCDISAPLPMLSTFRHPAYGIQCRVDNVSLSEMQWSALLLDKEVRVKLEGLENGAYKASFTEDLCNIEVRAALLGKTQPIEAVLSPDPSTSAPQVEPPHPQVVEGEHCSEATDANNGDKTPSPTLERPGSRGENRKTRNGTLREGHVSYQHPNARNGNSKADRDTNWRAGNGQNQEVIRQPRGPPPTTGPEGFQNKSASPSSDSPPQREPSFLTAAPAKSFTHQDQTAYRAQVVPQRMKDVQIVHVEGIDDFYVQFADVYSDLERLETELNAHYGSSETLKSIENPTVGQPCVAKYSDGGWYRGRITCLNGTDAEVFFVDYGNSQTTPVADIKVAETKFLAVPPLAYQCRLAGRKPQKKPAEKDKGALDSFTKNLQAIFLSQDVNGKYPVRLRGNNSKGRFSVNDNFVDFPVATAKPPTSRYTLIAPTRLSDYIIASFYCVGRFYLRNIDAYRFKDEEAEFEEFYSSLFEDELIETEPAIDLPCVVKSLGDGKCYRAKVKSIATDVAIVLFVDYGREQETPLKSLKRMLPYFMKWPALAWECSLKGVEANPDQEKAVADCFPEGETVQARLKLTAADGKFEAEVTHRKHGNIVQYLLGNQLAKLPIAPVDFATRLPAQDLDSIAAQVHFKNVMVHYAPSTSEFWAQLDTSIVGEMNEEIRVHTQEPEFQNESAFQPEVGKPCLACFDEDKNWYRAVIYKVNGREVSVQYVDYGNDGIIDVAELRGLPLTLAKQPPQAVKCFITGAKDLTEADAERFPRFIGNVINLEVVERVDDALCVRLTMLDGEVLPNHSTEGTIAQETDVQEKAMLEVKSHVTTSLGRPSVEAVPEPPLLIIALPEITHQTPPEPALPDSLHQTPLEIVSNISEAEVKELSTTPQPQNDFSSNGGQEEIAEAGGFLENKELEVGISYVVTPGDFWIQHSYGGFSTAQDQLDKISTLLNSSYRANINQYAVQGSIVASRVYGVLHPEYNEWFRARVTSINGADVQVRFIDYGDPLSVTVTKVLELPETLKKMPDLAVHCSIELPEGYDGWSLKAIKTLKRLETPCYAKFGKFEDGAHKVESLRCGDIDVIEEVRNALAEGLAEVINVTSASTCYGHLNELTPVTEYTEVESEQHLTLDENDVGPNASNSAASVEAPTAGRVPSLDNNGPSVNEELGLSMLGPPLTHSLLKAIECDVTMHSVGLETTRLDANISQAIDNTTIDTRTQEEEIEVKKEPNFSGSPLNAELPTGLLHQPVSCDLNQESAELVVTAESEGRASQPSLVLHAAAVEESEEPEPINAEFVYNQLEDEMTTVPASELTEVDENIASQGKMDDVEVPAANHVEEEYNDLAPVDRNQEAGEEVPGVILEPIESCVVTPEMETVLNEPEGREKVIVTFLQTTDHFWIQFAKHQADLDNLNEKLDITAKGTESKLTGNPVVRELYAVHSSQYDNWFRGRVVSVNGCESVVIFIDYGDSETVKLEKIRHLPESLRSIPPFAHECKWTSSAQNNEMWTEAAKEALNEICIQFPVDAVFKSRGGVLEVQSLYINGSNVADLITRRLNGESIDSIIQALEEGQGSDQPVMCHIGSSGAFIGADARFVSVA